MNSREDTASIGQICVYCGSGPGNDPAFVEAATALGTEMASNGIGLVYGGGGAGLMGAIAHAVIDNGGSVTGIIPEFLIRREHALKGAQEMIVTKDMHERKRKMFELADAFVAMPGGIGTLEEVIEQMTWAQLGRHKKPILLVNIKGFWAPLIELIAHMKTLGFIHSQPLLNYLVVDRVDDVLPALTDYMRQVRENGTERDLIKRL